jgi:hypothetical protein
MPRVKETSPTEVPNTWPTGRCLHPYGQSSSRYWCANGNIRSEYTGLLLVFAFRPETILPKVKQEFELSKQVG